MEQKIKMLNESLRTSREIYNKNESQFAQTMTNLGIDLRLQQTRPQKCSSVQQVGTAKNLWNSVRALRNEISSMDNKIKLDDDSGNRQLDKLQFDLERTEARLEDLKSNIQTERESALSQMVNDPAGDENMKSSMRSLIASEMQLGGSQRQHRNKIELAEYLIIHQ